MTNPANTTLVLGSRPTDDVYKVTGRQSTTLTDFARRTWSPEGGK